MPGQSTLSRVSWSSAAPPFPRVTTLLGRWSGGGRGRWCCVGGGWWRGVVRPFDFDGATSARRNDREHGHEPDDRPRSRADLHGRASARIQHSGDDRRGQQPVDDDLGHRECHGDRKRPARFPTRIRHTSSRLGAPFRRSPRLPTWIRHTGWRLSAPFRHSPRVVLLAGRRGSSAAAGVSALAQLSSS